MNKVNMRQGLEFEMKTFPSEGIRQDMVYEKEEDKWTTW